MKRLSEKETLKQQAGFYCTLSIVATLMWLTTVVCWIIQDEHRQHVIASQQKALADERAWTDVQSNMNTYIQKQFMEMQDYAKKLEHKLAKCQRDN